MLIYNLRVLSADMKNSGQFYPKTSTETSTSTISDYQSVAPTRTPVERFRFTEASIRDLETPRKRTVYRDTDIRGFICTVFPSGEKTFALYRWIDGKPERKQLGSFRDKTVKDVRTDAEKQIGKIAKGGNPAREDRERRRELTFGDLFASFLTLYAMRKKRTWRQDKYQYDSYLARPLGEKKLSSITRSDIARLHDEISLRGSYAANRALALVRKVFNWAIEREDFKGINPAAKFQRNTEVERDRYLSKEELERFWAALAEETDTTIRDYFAVALLTGGRRANLLAMEWAEIDWELATWVIPARKFKNGKIHNVPLLPEVLALLRARYADPKRHDTWVFPGWGESGHLCDPKNAFHKILRRAGIANVRAHDLRRTVGSHMAIAGVSLHTIGQVLGHQNVATTKIYARLNKEAAREGLELGANRMLAVLPDGGKLLPAVRDAGRE